MTKRLIDAAQAAINSYCGLEVGLNTRVEQLQAALDEARQPVTVTPDQAVEILGVMLTTCGEPATQEEVDALTAVDKLKIVIVVTAILQKARELGL